LPDFATDRLSRQRQAATARPPSGWPAELPLATVAAGRGGLRIAATNPAARAGGIRPGLPLADAYAVLPELRALPADPVAEAKTLDGLAAWCGRYTPWTAVDGEGGGPCPGAGGLWLDVTGCAHLFGGETALLQDVVGRLEGLGFAARAALADTPGAAWAVARFGGVDGKGPAVVPVGSLRAAVAPLPVAALRLDGAAAEGLRRVGLRHVGDLIDLPRAPLAARFGEAVLRRLDQALGRVGESLSPRRPVSPLRARLAFAEPIATPEDIAAALRHLLADLCHRLAETRQGARRLDLVLYRADGTCAGTAIGTSRPVRDAGHLERLFREKLENLDPGFGIEVMVLAAPVANALGPLQAELGAGGTAADEGLARLIDRLGNRLGAANVARLAPQASHIPEKACREEAALVSPAPSPAAAGRDDFRPAPSRPLHLLAWPEPVEVMAPVPDHPPLMFRWHGRPHRVVRADGPERIGPEWWLAEEPLDPEAAERATRDYYRVEDADGRRFWLYRQGLYRADGAPRWYLHGVFP
jgi:protein ImuB